MGIYTLVQQAQQNFAQAQLPPALTAMSKSYFLSDLLAANVYLKEENRQFTGSFKYRGALNKLLTLPSDERQRGLVTASSGNHGMGTALAASTMGVSVDIFVPHDVSDIKAKKIAQLGAQLHKVDGDCLLAEQSAIAYAAKHQQTYVSPYNDLHVIAGQGTIGLEMLQQVPELDAVIVAVGGGGLISGIGSAIKTINPQVEMIGCWPENSPVMYECMQADKVIDVHESLTLSDATAGGIEENTLTLALCQNVIDHCVLLSEAEIATALRSMLEYEQLLVEGSAALAVAASIKLAPSLKGKHVGVVLCGKNISYPLLCDVLSGAVPSA